MVLHHGYVLNLDLGAGYIHMVIIPCTAYPLMICMLFCVEVMGLLNMGVT